jgi:abortive infection bacteriophage resistance protein
VLDATERVEIAMRFSVAHTLGRRDPFGHLHPQSLDPRFSSGRQAGYRRWREGYDQTQARAREAFITHFEEQYEGRLPIWVAVEILQFGQLSVLFKGLKTVDRHQVSQSYGLSDPKVLASWLHCLTYVRTIRVCGTGRWRSNHDCPPPLMWKFSITSASTSPMRNLALMGLWASCGS